MHKLLAVTPLLALACATTPPAPTANTGPTKPSKSGATGPAATRLVFMTPAAGEPKLRNKPRVWQRIVAPRRIAKLTALAANEPARFALALYAEAWRLQRKPGRPVLHIAVEPGGNYAKQGFVTVDSTGRRHVHEHTPYLILAERPRTFRSTLLHETGHAIHALLTGAAKGSAVDHSVAPIPHSTSAITDRRTAFNEGFAIHLETVNAHCGRDPQTRAFYDRGRLNHGRTKRSALRSEYYAAARDLMTYAQTFARYQQVRDGLYAFAAATAGPSRSYLQLQLTPARDRRQLRSAGELVASEGFVASVVFQLVAGDGCTSLNALLPRYRNVFAGLRHAETTNGVHDHTPLLDFIHGVVAASPGLARRALDVFLDLSRGVTLDAGAAALWRQLYDAGLTLDRRAMKAAIKRIERRRATWQRDARASVAVLGRRIGAVLRVRAEGLKVGLVMFGRKLALSFDVNAVDPRILALVPALTRAQVDAIISERTKSPFRDLADFRARTAGLAIKAGALEPF